MISQTAEYACGAITHLAFNTGAPQTNKQIAELTRVPMPDLQPALQAMTRAGLVRSHRGLHGGSCSLARLIGYVFEVIELWSTRCSGFERVHGLAAHGVNLCPLHRRLDDAMALVERAFRESTIAEVIAEPSSSTPLCSVARALNVTVTS